VNYSMSTTHGTVYGELRADWREAAGVITAVGRKGRGFGGRSCCLRVSKHGAYSELRNVSADRLVKVPKGVWIKASRRLMHEGADGPPVATEPRVAQGRYPFSYTLAAGGRGSLVSGAKALRGRKSIGVVGRWTKAECPRLAASSFSSRVVLKSSPA